MNSKIATVGLILLVALATVGVCLAVYTITTNHVTGTPGAQATGTLTASTTTPVAGVSWTLTAHVSDNKSGLTVTLYNNDAAVTTATTDSSGNAVFTVAPTAAFNYYATIEHP